MGGSPSCGFSRKIYECLEKKQYQRRIDCEIVKKNHICSFEDRTSAGTPASTICPCMDAWAAMLDEFYDVFGVKEGDAMYIAPEDRTRIWS